MSERKPRTEITTELVDVQKRDRFKTEITKADNTWFYGNSSTVYSNGRYFLKPYVQTELEDIVKENIYSAACAIQRIQSTVGKGWSEDTDQEIKDLLHKKFLNRTCHDFNLDGEMYFEIKIKGKKPIALHHTPANITYLAKSKDSFIQNPNTKDEKSFPKFDEELYLKGKHPDGTFIWHKMNYFGNNNYGIPAWIGALDCLQIMDNAEKDIKSFYDNDAIPKTILMMFGIEDVNSKIKADFKAFLEQEYQGVSNNNKALIMSGLPPKQDGRDVEWKELNKSIVDTPYLNLMKEMKKDVCIAWRVPAELIGISQPGQLGNGQEIKTLLHFYLEDSIKPDQEIYYEICSVLFPNGKYELNTIEMPDFEEAKDIIEPLKAKMQNEIDNVIKAITLEFEDKY